MKALSALIAIVVLIAGTSVQAKDIFRAPPPPDTGPKIVSSMGGAIVPLHSRILDAGTGFPSAVFVRYHIPITSNFEIAPLFSFDYAIDTYIDVSNTFGAVIKLSLYSSPKFQLAVCAAPALRIGYYHSGWGFSFVRSRIFGQGADLAIQLGLPQVLMTIPINRKLVLDAGMKIPIAFFAYPNFVASIPILFYFGVEYRVLNKMNFFFITDFGPDILAATGRSDTEFKADLLLGISYRF